MDFKLIENLIKEMNKSSLTALEVEENGLKIRMEKKPELNNAITTNNLSTVPSVFAESKIESTIKAENVNLENNQENITVMNTFIEEKAEGNQIVSPMVGTFYMSQSPEHPPFVKVGDKVKKGQTLCIIEAMKLMNEIESEFDGEVKKVLIENEDMVEFGQPLFIIQ